MPTPYKRYGMASVQRLGRNARRPQGSATSVHFAYKRNTQVHIIYKIMCCTEQVRRVLFGVPRSVRRIFVQRVCVRRRTVSTHNN